MHSREVLERGLQDAENTTRQMLNGVYGNHYRTLLVPDFWERWEAIKQKAYEGKLNGGVPEPQGRLDAQNKGGAGVHAFCNCCGTRVSSRPIRAYYDVWGRITAHHGEKDQDAQVHLDVGDGSVVNIYFTEEDA